MIQDMRKRFSLYGLGFAIGIVMVFFFLGGKDASCNWMPNARMLEIIRKKQLNYTPAVQNTLQTTKIDSADIASILTNGAIDFSKSQTKNNPCRMYLINGKKQQKNMVLTVKICDSIATIESIKKVG